MQIDQQLISRLEHLSRLELSKEERLRIQDDLNKILEMVEKLSELDTKNVQPLVYINEEGNIWREDEIQHQLEHNKALKNAPDHDGIFFKVPKVIDLEKKQE